MKVEIEVAAEADIPEVRTLLRQYEIWTGTDLCFQDFDREVAELPGVGSPGTELEFAL